MAYYVSQSDGTIVPPSSPIEGVHVRRVGLISSRPQPKIPMQVFRLFAWIRLRHGTSLRPHRTVGPYLHRRYFADPIVIHPFLYHLQQWIGSTLVAHLGNDFLLPRHLGQLSCFLDVVGHRLLYVDM